MEKDLNNTISFGVGFLFILLFLYVLNPISRDAVGIYILFSIVAIFIYSRPEIRRYLIGMNGETFGKSMFWAIGLGAVYYLSTNFISGFSLGLPLLPNAISDELRFFIIVVVAPFVETLLIQGALFGYFKSVKSLERFALPLQALVFSLFHLSAYVSGLYNYPDFTSGLSAISANFSSFFSAFIFALIAGAFVDRKPIRNLWFVIIFHLILNLIIYTSLTVV